MARFLHYYLKPKGRKREDSLPTLCTLERDYIAYILDRTENNKTETAKILKVSRATLYAKLQKYGFCPQPFDTHTGDSDLFILYPQAFFSSSREN